MSSQKTEFKIGARLDEQSEIVGGIRPKELVTVAWVFALKFDVAAARNVRTYLVSKPVVVEIGSSRLDAQRNLVSPE